MSRVDDDRDAARLAQRLAEQRQKEQRRTDQRAADSAFAKLIQGQKQAEAEKPRPQRSAEGGTRPQPSGAGKKDQPRQPSAPAPSPFASRLTDSEATSQLKQRSQQGQELEGQGRGADRASGRGKSESRKGDAAVTERTLKERSSDGETSGVSALEGGRRDATPLRAQGDRGRGGGGKDGESKDGGGPQAGFRFNPALMAPVPVAAPKDTARLEKLRKLADEIAQKIVERARVGTNAAGQAEMQIDLRSTVLSGLSMKISCSGGRIRASFTATDREVIKMLRENEGALRSTLEGKGLRLEEFKVEERA